MDNKFFQSLNYNFRHIKKFLLEYKYKYLLGILFLMTADILQLIMPKILGIITDKLSSNSIVQYDFVFYIKILLIVAIGIAFCRFSWRMCIFGNSRHLEYNLRQKLFEHLELLSSDFYNHKKTGDLMAHGTNDIRSVRMAFGIGVVMAFDSVFLTITTVTMMFFNIQWKLTLIALIPLPIIAIFIGIFGKRVQLKFKVVQECFSKLTDYVQESFSGITIIKSFSQEKNSVNKFKNVNDLNFDKNLDLVKLYGLMMPMITFVSSISFLIALYLGGNMVIKGDLSLGQFVSFITYLGLLTWPMMAIGGVVNMLQRGIASMKRLNLILDYLPDIDDSTADFNITNINGDIEFKNLNFKYPNTNKYVLKNINFKLKQGQTIAVIGKTGSGKTTLVNLLLRRYEHYEGSILIDNKPIKSIPLNILTKNIGYVPQNTFLFSTSIKDNICFSDGNYTDDEILQATKSAQILKDINSFDLKFDTILGEKGVNLSGGQKQRVSISRALIKKPQILILDDSLSAVDTKTEENILNHLEYELKNNSAILISHRISTIKNADCILVLDKGEIIQQGNHEALLKSDGLYKTIFDKQQLEDTIRKEI